MNVVITGSSCGIGRAAAVLFLRNGHSVSGIDIQPDSITGTDEFTYGSASYRHFCADISRPETLPEIRGVEILINNAGVQSVVRKNDSGIVIDDIKVNLLGTMAVTEKYAFQPAIRSVLFNSSVSALTGNEFPSYVASKSGVNGYMRYAAIRLANQFRATCNSLCFGGVLTELNAPVTENEALWKKIMDVTPLGRWATAEQAAQWCYFMTVTNTFCTGQAIDISGGERNCADLFVWPDS